MNYLLRTFNNIHIRQAFALAINKDLIVKSAWKNTYLATNHIVPKGMTGYNADLTGPDGTTSTSGNQDEAKRLFEQGLQEEQMTLATFPSIRFTYTQTSQDTANEVATVIEMWQTVLGVNIEPHPVDKTELFTAVANTTGNTNLQLWRVDWIADYPDPQDWLSLQFGKGASNNNVNYGQNQSSDASQQLVMQQQMEQADGMGDQDARIKVYNQVEQQLVNDVAWLPIEQVTVSYLLKPYVIGVADNALDLIPPNDWVKIDIAQH